MREGCLQALPVNMSQKKPSFSKQLPWSFPTSGTLHTNLPSPLAPLHRHPSASIGIHRNPPKRRSHPRCFATPGPLSEGRQHVVRPLGHGLAPIAPLAPTGWRMADPRHIHSPRSLCPNRGKTRDCYFVLDAKKTIHSHFGLSQPGRQSKRTGSKKLPIPSKPWPTSTSKAPAPAPQRALGPRGAGTRTDWEWCKLALYLTALTSFSFFTLVFSASSDGSTRSWQPKHGKPGEGSQVWVGRLFCEARSLPSSCGDKRKRTEEETARVSQREFEKRRLKDARPNPEHVNASSRANISHPTRDVAVAP